MSHSEYVAKLMTGCFHWPILCQVLQFSHWSHFVVNQLILSMFLQSLMVVHEVLITLLITVTLLGSRSKLRISSHIFLMNRFEHYAWPDTCFGCTVRAVKQSGRFFQFCFNFKVFGIYSWRLSCWTGLIRLWLIMSFALFISMVIDMSSCLVTKDLGAKVKMLFVVDHRFLLYFQGTFWGSRVDVADIANYDIRFSFEFNFVSVFEVARVIIIFKRNS